SVSSIQISPDNSRVIYRARQELFPFAFLLYSVPLAGGPVTKLNGPLVNRGDVSGFFQISPDSRRVVYVADRGTDGVEELYRVPLAGGPVPKLNGPLVAGGDVSAGLGGPLQFFRISPNSRRVVYMADQDTDQVFELYTLTSAQLVQDLIIDVQLL